MSWNGLCPIRPEGHAVNERFADLGAPRRIWAVACINGDIDRLAALHDHLARRFGLRDRIVYLGNYLGAHAGANAEVIDELLAFRAAILAKPGIEASDIVYLRGPAEEAWQRLLRLQFAPVPAQALDKLLAAGVESWLRLYGVSLNDTRSMARAGSMAITRWTNQLRGLQRMMPGHEALVCGMRRTAFSRPSSEPPYKKVLFVPAGFDPLRTLDDQGDGLWWPTTAFAAGGMAQETYVRVVRGFDAANGGLNLENSATTLDAGCGRGGALVCGGFTPNGQLADLVTVGGASALDGTPFAPAEDEDFTTLGEPDSAGAALPPEYRFAATA